ncbi:hypothetical protein Ciccas_006544 [Cichlidogyrus casuarinus]|uniref:Uncharacterized protein n=1 Tax=Cichlidogyrus casuarinus TaxID=1844966 RepID=A0ABD2Q6G9_9PLAT
MSFFKNLKRSPESCISKINKKIKDYEEKSENLAAAIKRDREEAKQYRGHDEDRALIALGNKKHHEDQKKLVDNTISRLNEEKAELEKRILTADAIGSSKKNNKVLKQINIDFDECMKTNDDFDQEIQANKFLSDELNRATGNAYDKYRDELANLSSSESDILEAAPSVPSDSP